MFATRTIGARIPSACASPWGEPGAGVRDETDEAAVIDGAEDGAQHAAFRSDPADRDPVAQSGQGGHRLGPLAEGRPSLDECSRACGQFQIPERIILGARHGGKQLEIGNSGARSTKGKVELKIGGYPNAGQAVAPDLEISRHSAKARARRGGSSRWRIRDKECGTGSRSDREPTRTVGSVGLI